MSEKTEVKCKQMVSECKQRKSNGTTISKEEDNAQSKTDNNNASSLSNSKRKRKNETESTTDGAKSEGARMQSTTAIPEDARIKTEKKKLLKKDNGPGKDVGLKKDISNLVRIYFTETISEKIYSMIEKEKKTGPVDVHRLRKQYNIQTKIAENLIHEAISKEADVCSEKYVFHFIISFIYILNSRWSY